MVLPKHEIEREDVELYQVDMMHFVGIDFAKSNDWSIESEPTPIKDILGIKQKLENDFGKPMVQPLMVNNYQYYLIIYRGDPFTRQTFDRGYKAAHPVPKFRRKRYYKKLNIVYWQYINELVQETLDNA